MLKYLEKIMDKIKFELDILDVLKRHGFVDKEPPKAISINLMANQIPYINITFGENI